jgi:hypothetical protein
VEHEPDIPKHAFRFMDVHGFLVQRLTGRFTTSLASADSFGLTDMAEETWATDLITGIGLRPEKFCDTVQPGETIDEVTGEAARSTGLPAGQAPARGARERLDPDRVHGGGRDGGSWPQALRRVRGWLAPWVLLGRCWSGWSTGPPSHSCSRRLTGSGLDDRSTSTCRRNQQTDMERLVKAMVLPGRWHGFKTGESLRADRAVAGGMEGRMLAGVWVRARGLVVTGRLLGWHDAPGQHP